MSNEGFAGVWMVTEGSHEDYRVLGICSTEAKAEALMKLHEQAGSRAGLAAEFVVLDEFDNGEVHHAYSIVLTEAGEEYPDYPNRRIFSEVVRAGDPRDERDDKSIQVSIPVRTDGPWIYKPGFHGRSSRSFDHAKELAEALRGETIARRQSS